MTFLWREQIEKLKAEVITLYLAYRDPRTPWYARIFTAVVVSYALSPIDLIPDFIPVVGILDDLVLVPIGLTLAIKMIPSTVMDESRVKAIGIASGEKPVSRSAAIVIIIIWFLSAALATHYGLRIFHYIKEGL